LRSRGRGVEIKRRKKKNRDSFSEYVDRKYGLGVKASSKQTRKNKERERRNRSRVKTQNLKEKPDKNDGIKSCDKAKLATERKNKKSDHSNGDATNPAGNVHGKVL